MADSRASRLAIGVALVAIVMAAGAIRLHDIGRESLWLDEAGTVKVAALPFFQAATADPYHPPLFYAAMHLWLKFGDDEATLRAFSCLFAVATVPLVYLFGALLGDAPLGLLAAALFALAPFQVRYAQEARMYALLAFEAATALCGLVVVLLVGSRDCRAASGILGLDARLAERLGWVVYVFGNALMLWTHYTSLLFVCAVNTCVFALLAARILDRSFLARWILAQIAVLALWAPVIPRFLLTTTRVVSTFWIPDVNVARVTAVVRKVYLVGFAPGAPVWLGVGVSVLAVLGAWKLRRDAVALAVCASVIIVPLAAETGSGLVRSILLERTLIWTAIPFLVLVATALLAIPAMLPRAAAVAAVLALAAVDLHAYYTTYHKEAWEQAARHVAGHVGDDDLIVFVACYIDVPFDHYFGSYHRDVDRYGVVGSPVLDRSVDEVSARAAAHAHVWLVMAHARYQDADGKVLARLRDRCKENAPAVFFEVAVYSFESCR